MNFCPECGALLQVAKKGTLLRCSKCKYQKTIEQGETARKTNIHSGKPVEIAVVDKAAASLRQLSTVRIVCPVCGHTESETWTVETANETVHSTVTFFRCTSCGATRREAG
jgi:DNA-directed RNA polymerase subunit M/transcription elongation factor TFIIS